MKHFSNLVLLTLLFSTFAWSQPGRSPIVKPIRSFNRVWVTPVNSGGRSLICTLYNVGDTSLVISSSRARADYLTGNYSTTTLIYSDISLIQLRSATRKTKGVLLGALAGATAGVLMGLIEGDDPRSQEWFKMKAEDKARLYGTTFGLLGGCAGFALGSLKISFPIEGSRANYLQYRKRLQRYTPF